MGRIPGLGTKIPHALWCCQKKGGGEWDKNKTRKIPKSKKKFTKQFTSNLYNPCLTNVYNKKWQRTTELQYTKIPFLEWKFPSSVLISRSLFTPIGQLVVQKGRVGKVIMRDRPTSFPYHPLLCAVVFTNLSKVYLQEKTVKKNI